MHGASESIEAGLLSQLDLLVQIPAAMSAEMVPGTTHKAEGSSLSSVSRAVDAVLLSMNAGCRKSLCWVQS